MIEAKAIIEVFVREASLDPATLTLETVIRNLGVDSLDIMNVLFSLEEATGVALGIEEMEEVTTIGADPDYAMPLPLGMAEPIEHTTLLSNSFAFGGLNSVLVARAC